MMYCTCDEIKTETFAFYKKYIVLYEYNNKIKNSDFEYIGYS